MHMHTPFCYSSMGLLQVTIVNNDNVSLFSIVQQLPLVYSRLMMYNSCINEISSGSLEWDLGLGS